jgi:cellulose synthase/poly-beta-1,6-N-acetylglucosamine synthase-like glycosyltransferase
MQFHLLYKYYKHKNHIEEVVHLDSYYPDWPFVTVQLPIYNEYYVVERLIDCIADFDYPKEQYEIHILDDSDDDTVHLVEQKVKEYSEKGFQIKRITRKERKGYKAGALKDGMSVAKGKYIAIFDADFLPERDFLKQTIPHFSDPKVGVVQTRWEHINRDYSLITKLQAFQLNVHFTVEQQGREAADYLLQFNGTAGVWRRTTIEHAGGWEADTLTEDLDLSYRAQLKGWKIVYLEEIGSPAELPAEMNGLKSQQFRWMKGGAETAKKMLPTVWKSNLPLIKKVHASVHLLSSSVFLSVFVVGVLSVPLLFVLEPLGFKTKYFAIFLISMMSIVAVYFVANIRTTWRGENIFKVLFKFIFLFPVFLALSMGLSLHNSIAVLQGYMGRKTAFIRTPKFNIKSISDRFSSKKYQARKIPFTTIIEGLLSIYFFWAIFMGIEMHNNSFIFLHILLALGYGAIFYYSLKHLRLK